ncbi:MAG: molecular chaperone HtpG [Erysipelotrichaceae bacterium]|nr:molecular chaperone HtpG [Erysipelotrichaceae bacterium]
MKKKEFKAESKKLLSMMINSIYTNKEIAFRELISNASDAIDKLVYLSATNGELKADTNNLKILIELDKENRTIKITDNGIGMTDVELESNLGTIAKSGSELFKEENSDKKNLEIIGQFGVGFYSSFMISKRVSVLSRKAGVSDAYLWESDGTDGFTITKSEMPNNGTVVTLYLKDNTEDNNYDEYLEDFTISRIVKKYSDYIKYPIQMEVETEKEDETDKSKKIKVKELKTLNSMVPIWKKNKKDVKEEEYNDFYADKFYDYEKPLKVIKSDVEGLTSYSSLLFIPSHAPYNYYTKDYEKGLMLYSKGVMIMDKCSDLLPDYFSFVKGIVDSEDISLNISRETMQSDKQIKVIARSLETKIKKELVDMLKNERDNYIKFYEAFGEQLKYGIYSSYGMNKEVLQDLLLFYSSRKEKLITLDEYLEDISDDTIYYASGETIDKIKMLPNVINALNSNKNVLFLTNYLDEFVIKVLGTYKDKKFMNVLSSEFDLSTEEEKENLKKVNEDNKSMLDKMTSILNNQVKNVRFTNKLKDHAVCLTSEGDVSLEMEKVLNAMPNGESVKANKILEINENSKIADKLKELYASNSEELEKYTKILYNQARLIEGLSVENPTELTSLICEIMAK